MNSPVDEAVMRALLDLVGPDVPTEVLEASFAYCRDVKKLSAGAALDVILAAVELCGKGGFVLQNAVDSVLGQRLSLQDEVNALKEALRTRKTDDAMTAASRDQLVGELKKRYDAGVVILQQDKSKTNEDHFGQWWGSTCTAIGVTDIYLRQMRRQADQELTSG